MNLQRFIKVNSAGHNKVEEVFFEIVEVLHKSEKKNILAETFSALFGLQLGKTRPLQGLLKLT